MNITQRFIDNIKPTGKTQFFRDERLKGFGARLSPEGTVAFIVEAKVNGQSKRRTLGRHPILNVREARTKALELLATMRDGEDPREAERRKAAEKRARDTTLADLLSSYQDARELKASTCRDQENAFRNYLSEWMNRPVRYITREDVEKKFIALRKAPGLATATKVNRYLSAVLSFAKAGDILDANPCEIIKDKRISTKVKRRNNALSEANISNLLEYLLKDRRDPLRKDQGVSDQAANLVVLLLHTGLRKGEALSLKWEDVDLSRNTMTVRGTKNGSDFTLPLTAAAINAIEDQENRMQNEFVFPSNLSQSGRMTEPKKQIAKINKFSGVKFTLHDLRRTFATHAAMHGMDQSAIKRALNHKSADVTEGYIIKSADLIRPVFEAVAEQYAHYMKQGFGKAPHSEEGTQIFTEDLIEQSKDAETPPP